MAGHLRGLDDRHPASINLRPTGSGTRPFSGEFFLAYIRDPASQLPPRAGSALWWRAPAAPFKKIGATRRRLDALSVWGGRGHEYGFWKRFGDDTTRRVPAVPPARSECGIPLARRLQYGIHGLSETLPS